MPTNYPNSLDNFINPTFEDDLDSVLVPHAGQHSVSIEVVSDQLSATVSTSTLNATEYSEVSTVR